MTRSGPNVPKDNDLVPRRSATHRQTNNCLRKQFGPQKQHDIQTEEHVSQKTNTCARLAQSPLNTEPPSYLPPATALAMAISLLNILFSPESISSTTFFAVYASHEAHVFAVTAGMTLFSNKASCSIVLIYRPPLTCHAMWQWKGQVPGLSVLYCRTMYAGLVGVPPCTSCVSRRCVLAACVMTPFQVPKPSASTLKLCPCRCIGCEARKVL